MQAFCVKPYNKTQEGKPQEEGVLKSSRSGVGAGEEKKKSISRYLPKFIEKDSWSLQDIPNKRRNAKCEETFRIDRINCDEYSNSMDIEYEYNYDSSKTRKPGLEIHIVASDIILLNKTNTYAEEKKIKSIEGLPN
mgnify:CR=1 FL=1